MNQLVTGSSPEVVAVVPAAGTGSRMQLACPKQYLTIGHCTLLEHSVARLLVHPAVTRVVIVLSPEDCRFQQLPLAQDKRITTVSGGKQRADSVLAGLHAAGSSGWVLVHDAARPCLNIDDLTKLLKLMQYSSVGGILAVPVRDTMKQSAPGGSVITHTPEREHLWHALTPQLFPLPLLRECLQRALRDGAHITDEASALEYCGYQPELVPGRSDNLKVTRPEDLALARFYLAEQYKEQA